MPITATQLWVVPLLSLSSLSLSLSLEIAQNYHCREDDNDNEDAQRDVGEDVGKVDFSQQLAGTL